MLVVGTGAVASFLLPRLARSVSDLQVFGPSSPRLLALEGYGAVASPMLLEVHQDWLIVCKVGQNAEKIRQLRHAPPPRRILVLQNGLAPEADWRAAWPGVRVERGLSTYGVSTVAPGLARGGESGEIVVPRFSPWMRILSRAGLTVRATGDIRAAIWTKLLVNASLNVVAAIGDLENGQVLEEPLARAHAAKAAEEVDALARYFRVRLKALDPVRVMEDVARATADNVCSTLADLRSGRVSEYEAINGELLRLARRYRLKLPTLEELDRQFALMLSMRCSIERLAS